MKACVTQNAEGTLTSALLELRALHHASLPPARGHLIHAMFHQLLTRIDPALSAQLHQAGIHRPFTLSPLLENQREEQTIIISEGTTYHIRITLLDGGYLWHCLSTLFLEGGPCTVRLGKATLLLTRLISTGDPTGWAGNTTWQELASLSPRREITFSFTSPTAFHTHEDAFTVVPEPLLVWGSLMRTWNCLAPASLFLSHAVLREIIAHGITVLTCDLSTRMLHYPKYTQNGFLGTCTYRLPREEKPATQLTCLAAFARFAGVGYKTTMGMGQVRSEAKA